MSQYELIAFDMDGTLLNSSQKITANTRQAIDRAVTAGKTVILATGRCPSELMDYREELQNIRYYICSSGAAVFDSLTESVLFSETIPENTVRKIMRTAEPADAMLYIASGGRHMCTHREVLRMEHYQLGQYKDLMMRTALLHEDMISAYRQHPFPVEKLNIFCASPQIRKSLHDALKTLPVTMAYAEETSLEISPLHVSKALGLKRICRHLSIPLEKTIAVGDSDNDSEILKAAGFSAAMGNAAPHIKKLCQAIVADNDHEGCAEAIDDYLLGNS